MRAGNFTKKFNARNESLHICLQRDFCTESKLVNRLEVGTFHKSSQWLLAAQAFK